MWRAPPLNLYSRAFVKNLVNLYFTKQEVMRIMGYKKSGLYYWIKSNGIEQVIIGNVMLIPKNDVMAKIRGK